MSAPNDVEPAGAPPGGRSRITEIKHTLSGGEKRFDCTVLLRTAGHLVVLFIAPTAMHVHGVDLPAGTVTLGHFWLDRPYNVYHWLERTSGETIGCYVNLADSTVVTENLLEWRDLAVDILLRPDGTAVVLDEDEVPAELPPAIVARIADARATVLASRTELLAELEADRRVFWPSLASPAGRQEPG